MLNHWYIPSKINHGINHGFLSLYSRRENGLKYYIETMMVVMKHRIPIRENVVERLNLILDSKKAPRMTHLVYWWVQEKQRERLARNRVRSRGQIGNLSSI